MYILIYIFCILKMGYTSILLQTFDFFTFSLLNMIMFVVMCNLLKGVTGYVR